MSTHKTKGARIHLSFLIFVFLQTHRSSLVTQLACNANTPLSDSEY